MPGLTIPPADRPLLRRALERRLRVLGVLGPDCYAVTSHSHPERPHRVDLARGTCDCPLNYYGHQRCPHLVLTDLYTSFARSQEVAS